MNYIIALFAIAYFFVGLFWPVILIIALWSFYKDYQNE